tara:strand:- start:1 stop:414 length:414 start_codon:yes stop_codon:yes gene_type:complete
MVESVDTPDLKSVDLKVVGVQVSLLALYKEKEMFMSQKYKVSTAFCWYNEASMIVKMYFMNEIPFTFDELPDGHLYDQDLIKEADKNQSFEAEDLYRNSNYLIEEEAHPCFFMMDIENPEDLPDEAQVSYDEEDLLG